jgi:hypothetical protein
MLQSDQKGKYMDFITCNSKKNRPRINVAVCAKCRRRRNCADYGNYLQFPLFPELFEFKTRARKRYLWDAQPKRMKPEVAEGIDRPEQLGLNLWSRRHVL